MKTKTLYAAVLLMLTGCIASAQTITRCGGPTNALSINWPTFGFDVCHTGYNPYENRINTANVNSLEKAWSNDLGFFQEVFTPVVVDGVVYYGSHDGTVRASRADNGHQIWRYDTGNAFVASPTVVNGIVYIGSTDHNMYALDAKTGALVWQYAISSPVQNGATVVDGRVYVTGGSGLYALDAATGALRWFTFNGTGLTGPAAVVNGVVYLGGAVGHVAAFNAVTGSTIWDVNLGQNFQSAPAVINGIIYIGSLFGNFFALDAVTGAKLWQFGAGGAFASAPAVGRGMVYAGGLSKLYAFDANTGQILFTAPIKKASGASLANGLLYVIGDDGYFDALDANNGQMLWTYPLGDGHSAPAIANGMVYVGTYAGSLYAFHLSGQ